MTTSKTLGRLARQHPDKIDSIERDEDGWIVHLTDEYVETSDPLRPTHTIMEDTVAECVAEFRSIRRARRGE